MSTSVVLAPEYVHPVTPYVGPPVIERWPTNDVPSDMNMIQESFVRFAQMVQNGDRVYGAMFTNNSLSVMSECFRGLSMQPLETVKSQMAMHCTAALRTMQFYKRLPGTLGPYFAGAGNGSIAMMGYSTFTSVDNGVLERSNGVDFYGDPLMPMQAIGYWLFGKGVTRNVRIESLNLQMVATDFKPIVNILSNPDKGAGAYRIKEPFSYNVFDKAPIDLPAAGMLGRISGEVEGTLELRPNGTYSFNGVYRLNPDLYDAGSSNRTPAQEGLTTFLRRLGETFGHTDYSINIVGEKTVSFSGGR
ncbi:hypothetical protein A9978_31705 [Pseudomonas sp. UMC65]|uniref:lipid II-degrading bacteriocin n=2 Tax=Pseudomonas TaxID=286 RepID=UPI000A844B4B|nr:hypothetical protein [Pseudomonas sp. UMC65]MBB1623089.1 hypothetical protein [Pseudomonas sp. UME65]